MEIFLLSGTNNYEVDAEIDQHGEIVYTNCDCPHQVEICKHLIAAFYTINDYLNNPKKIQYNEDDLKTLLQKQDKDTLIHLIVQLANEDISLKESLIFHFSDMQDYQVAENLLFNIVSEIEDYEEIPQTQIERLDNVVADIYYKVDQLIKESNDYGALEISLLILNAYATLNANIEYDDFYEEYYEAVTTIENIIKSIIQSSKSDKIKSTYDLLVKKYENTKYDEKKEVIIDLLVDFTILTDYRNSVEQIIKNYYQDYFEGWLETQIKIHKLNNKTDKIIKLTSLNLEYPSMREYVIKTNLEEKNYIKVLEFDDIEHI